MIVRKRTARNKHPTLPCLVPCQSTDATHSRVEISWILSNRTNQRLDAKDATIDEQLELEKQRKEQLITKNPAHVSHERTHVSHVHTTYIHHSDACVQLIRKGFYTLSTTHV